jgi:hypothetical protein
VKCPERLVVIDKILEQIRLVGQRGDWRAAVFKLVAKPFLVFTVFEVPR